MKKQLFAILFFFISLSSLVAQDGKSELNNYLRNFQYQRALEYIDAQEPTKELLMHKAFCYKALGNYHKAIEVLYPLTQEYPDDIQLKSELALCYQAVAQLQASVDCYDELIRVDSTNAYFKIQKAEMLYQQGNYNKALALYQAMQQGGMTNMIKRSAQCFEKMNMPDSAMLYYKEAWDINEKDAFSAASLINICLKTDRAIEAKAYSDMFLERDSTDKQINLLNALSYYSLDLYEEAAERFEKCYEQGDSSLIVNRSLGIAYYSLAENRLALKYLDKAYVQDSTNMNVLYCLAVVCNEEFEPLRAAHYYKKLLDRTIPPDMTLYLYYRGLAIAYEKSDQFQKSVDTYKLALKYATPNQQMYTYYAMAQMYEFSLRNNTDAYTYYQLYRTSLNDYLSAIKGNEELDLLEIKTGEAKIGKLDEYIEKLRASIKQSGVTSK